MRAKQLKQVLTTAWLVSGFVVSSYRSFCLQKPGHRHGLGRLAAPNKDPQGIKPVEENEPRVLFSRDDLQKLTNVQLKEILRALGLKVSGRKADLVERLVDHKAEIQGVRSGKREIPKAEEPAILETDVFIALDKTVQKLETLLQEERVVFLRAGVASGKSTLAQYLCREQPSKYLQVCPPAPGKETDAECWYKALLQAVSPADVVRDLQIAFELLSKNEQVLVFDECNLLFACPAFYQQFLKTPPYLTQRPMVLLLSAASELQSVERPTFTTPCEISGKYMWTPPIPHAKALVNQLAQADVHLSEAAVEFFLSFSGGHRGIFMRAMEWVQKKQEGTGKKWTVARAYGEVKLAWAGGDWIDQESFLGTLATGTNSIRVNGHGDLAMPQKFLEILCGGATRDLDSEDRRNLAIHGLLLPVAESRRDEEFVPYDWSLVGANYGVSNHLLASYYRYVLEKKRELEVEVNMNSSSGIDLLLRVLPYLHFSTVVGSVILQNNEVQATFSARGHLAEVHYTGAIIQILERLGFSAKSVETGTEGNVDVYCTTQDDSTFAIEAVMAAREPADIEEHRNRFDQVTNYYADAKHKCLLIIGRKDSKLRQLVQGTRGGIEIVGLAANSAHTGYHVYVKQLEQQGEEVLDFYIPCDGVARSFAFKDEEPFFEISSAQKFKSIQPGTPSPTQTKAVWVRQLQKDGEKVELVGNAFQVLGELANVDHLKKAIEKEEKLSIAPSKIDIFSQQQDGKWIREEKMSESLRDTSKTDCYGFTIPST